MSRLYSIAIGIAVLVVALDLPAACYGAWAFMYPAEDQELSKSMSVNAYGTGEGAATDLWFAVWRTVELNHGLGEWEGGPGPWTASAAPPTGGWGNGAATMKIWKLGEQDTGVPLATRDTTFVD